MNCAKNSKRSQISKGTNNITFQVIQRRKGTPQKRIHSETRNDLQLKTNIKLETMLIKGEKTRFFKNYVNNILFVRLTATLEH